MSDDEKRSLWDAIKERETLADFWCDLPGIGDTPPGPCCAQKWCSLAEQCERLAYSREYLAMRAVVEAVIGPHPDGLAMQIEHYRELAEMALDAGSSGASASHGYTRLGDALRELA